VNIDIFELWTALQHLPLAISITVYALILLSVACFVFLPLGIMLRSEPVAIIRSFNDDRKFPRDTKKWRYALHQVSAWLTLVNTVVGRIAAWLVLYMVLMQLVVVIMRYVFAFGSVQMQESIWYMHGLLFMLGAGYTLAKDRHVRLDIFYREARRRTKARINLFGSLVFIMPFCIVVFDFATPLVRRSWAVREGSLETLGMPYLYLLKSVILVFCIIVAVEGVSLALRSIIALTEGRAEQSQER